MKSSLKHLLPFVLLIPLVLGCALAEKLKQKIEEASPPKLVTATDGSCRVTVPGLWDKVPAQTEGALIRASNMLDDTHLLVLREDKRDFASDITVEDYTDLIRKNVATTLEASEFSEISKYPSKDYDCRSFEVTGVIQKVKIKYLQVVVSTPDEFFRLILWTTPSKFEKSKFTFLSIVNSFRVIPQGQQSLEEDEPTLEGSGDGPPPPPTPDIPAPRGKKKKQ